MAKLIATAFVTLDGVMQAPGGAGEDRTGGFTHGGWVMPHFGDDPIIDEVYGRATAFLLGRGTYDIFASYWPHVTDEHDAVATALNRLPKYVVSRSLREPAWGPATVVRDAPRQIARLKRELQGELQVHGSAGLLQTLLAYELLDELNVMTFPVVLGKGKRLFGDGTVPAGLELIASRATGKGVVIASYRFAGRPVLCDVTMPE